MRVLRHFLDNPPDDWPLSLGALLGLLCAAVQVAVSS